MKFLTKWSEEILGATRIVSAFMYMQHGGQKIFGFPVEAHGTYSLFTLSPGLAGLLEVILGPLLLIGLFTRQVAFILSGTMAFAYFMVHFPRNFWTLANGGDAAVMYCFFFLYLAAAGPGKWSVDGWLAKKR